MRRFCFVLAITGMVISSATRPAVAQQRRPLIVTFGPAPVATTQFSPDSGNVNSTSSDSVNSRGNSTSALNTTAAPPTTTTPPGLAGGAPPVRMDQTVANQNPRPTNQQLQNASGGYQLTHFGFSQGQYTSKNNYVGSQFNTWNNLRTQSTTLDTFESFNRTQPPIYSGAYISPNSYYGTSYNQWSNLSSGNITPNYMGGWIYQQ